MLLSRSLCRLLLLLFKLNYLMIANIKIVVYVMPSKLSVFLSPLDTCNGCSSNSSCQINVSSHNYDQTKFTNIVLLVCIYIVGICCCCCCCLWVVCFSTWHICLLLLLLTFSVTTDVEMNANPFRTFTLPYSCLFVLHCVWLFVSKILPKKELKYYTKYYATIM